jgi:hypothetical protein
MAVALAHLSLLPAVSARSLGELLALVDELPEGATGELVFGEGGEPVGSVFIERGRVCWAAARGLGQRLIDILARTSGRSLDPAVVESVYRRCREARVPFGEKLVEEGFISRDELRKALLRHTLESCAVLAERQGRTRWLPRAHGGYSAAFTYSTIELLVTTGAMLDASRAEAARRELERVGGTGVRGAAFTREAGLAEPTAIAALDADAMKPAALRAIGRWAADALDIAAAVTPDVRFHVVSTASGRAALTWQRAAVAHVVLAANHGSLSRALVTLVRDEAVGS